jgi:hypothetical protein
MIVARDTLTEPATVKIPEKKHLNAVMKKFCVFTACTACEWRGTLLGCNKPEWIKLNEFLLAEEKK